MRLGPPEPLREGGGAGVGGTYFISNNNVNIT